jgi:hypothetical protein
MWGFYERGFVAPLYPKQGWDLFVPWERVKELRVRRMALSLEGSSREGELFLFRFEDVQGLVHRFREDTLIRYFGYSGAETAKFHEEALVMARAHLPPEQITIEPDLATS